MLNSSLTFSNNSSYKGYAQVFLAAMLFGFIGIFVKLIQGLPPEVIIFYRMFFGMVALIIFLILSKRLRELRIQKKKKYIILLGMFQAGTMFCYFYTIRHTDVSVAVLLLYTAPIHVTLFSPLLLKEPFSRRGLVAMFISAIGVILVNRSYMAIHDVTTLNLIGLASGLASGIFYACMIFTSRHLRDSYSGVTQSAWSFAVMLLVFIPYSFSASSTSIIDNLFILILFGLLPTAVGQLLQFNGLRYVKAQHVSIIGLIEPISTVTLAYLFLHERISLTMLAGGILILFAAFVVAYDRRPRSVKATSS